MPVLANKPSAVLYGKVNEFLIVCVFAGQTRFGRNVDQLGVLIELTQHGIHGQSVKR